MGRLFRAARLGKAARDSLNSRTVNRVTEVAPPWLEVLETIPPTEILVRTIPVQHQTPAKPLRKPRNTYRPQHIVYEEDELRTTFFKDHPWELARPRVMLETDGKDYQRVDWSKGLRQIGLPVTGESVVQRQMWLMHNNFLSKEQAYDVARRELYTLRHKEDVERRVAQEEARMVGAYFGKSALQVGMTIENRTYEGWKRFAQRQTAKIEAMKAKQVAAQNITGEAEDAEEAPAPAA